MFGTGTNTYTTPGITSAASTAAQGAPTRIVTTNEAGDLAAQTFADLGLAPSIDVDSLQSRIDRQGRDINENAEGVAVSMATSDPDLFGGQVFAIKGNWGNFEGSNALGFALKGRVAEDMFGTGTQLTVSGGAGFGLNEGTIGGRISAQVGW
jgi:hypothetical protein